MNVNFWEQFFCSKYFLPVLTQQSDSRLTNVISDFALMGFPGKTAYASSKGSVVSFTNALKTELANSSLKVCLVIRPCWIQD
jgi:NAD(P)-dependent dehydrogenase (short-subunit alcohol dehydrogenase family)